jgi:hypothetical protein
MLDFQELWDNYPQDWEPCKNLKGEPNFENQCAIRMGVALARCKFRVKNSLPMYDFHGERCWHHPDADNHTLRVEELRDYLIKKLPRDILTIGRRKIDDLISPDICDGAEGIVLFLNFWGDRNRGDHIDLINYEGELKTGELDYFERSERVYFWNLS